MPLTTSTLIPVGRKTEAERKKVCALHFCVLSSCACDGCEGQNMMHKSVHGEGKYGKTDTRGGEERLGFLLRVWLGIVPTLTCFHLSYLQRTSFALAGCVLVHTRLSPELWLGCSSGFRHMPSRWGGGYMVVSPHPPGAEQFCRTHIGALLQHVSLQVSIYFLFSVSMRSGASCALVELSLTSKGLVLRHCYCRTCFTSK